MTALYLHIPFCKNKCAYCDFFSYAGKEEQIDEYVDALCQEINSPPLSPSLIKTLPGDRQGGGKSDDSRTGGELKTIYFGGGTPTLLSPKHFKRIISTILEHCKLNIEHCEISVEANPGTADLTKLKALRRLGINRLSIGVQSFNDKHLKTLGRIHTAKEAIKFYKAAGQAGFENINLDLIFALPDQTLSEWQADLQQVIDLDSEHLSCYCLSGRMAQNNEDLELAMYEYTIEKLTSAGYKHYEISNFAKPGCECQHNLVYWHNANYIGIGTSAHSHFEGKRWDDNGPIECDDKREAIIMGLRLIDGISKERFKGFESEVTELKELGLLEKTKTNYKLTRKGLYLANEVMSRFV